jgi:hypothetical protein
MGAIVSYELYSPMNWREIARDGSRSHMLTLALRAACD